jgi:hypothetical protein
VIVLVTVTLMICIAAAVVAFSGVWILFVFVALARFGPWSRGGGPRGGYGYRGPGYDGRRGRSAHWVR